MREKGNTGLVFTRNLLNLEPVVYPPDWVTGMLSCSGWWLVVVDLHPGREFFLHREDPGCVDVVAERRPRRLLLEQVYAWPQLLASPFLDPSIQRSNGGPMRRDHQIHVIKTLNRPNKNCLKTRQSTDHPCFVQISDTVGVIL